MKKSAASNKTLRLPVFFLSLFLGLAPAYAATGEGESFKIRAKRSLQRGGIKMAGALLEIPITLQEYHEKAGYPLVRHTTGIFEGAFRALHRFESGLWDFVSVLLPGRQKALPVQPETLF